ncbi:MAG TPA: tripartite tricarboxylate transporter substrate binding protein [Burkholderiales bacterium]|nr:tripartite tricarboxylate transporter substrate binding protein [Burkholderiales bacterium]
MKPASALLLLPLLAAWIHPCPAQSYPSRPIDLISPTGAGGGSDLVARMVAEIVAKEKLLPQPMIVQNKPGGGGAVGLTYAAGKKGDPYTILLTGTTLISVPVRTGLDVGLDKFQPIAAIGFDLNSLAVREDSPFRTLKDFLEAARANPKTINVGITFPGGSAHQMIHRLEKLAGVRINTVSFKSGTDTVTAVLGGHVHATAENLGEVMPHVETKKLRLLGVPAAARLSGLPNVPTLKEQGYDIRAGGLRSFVAPAGVPRDVVVRLEGVFAKVHKSAAWREYMTRNMYEDVWMGSDEFGKWLVAQQGELTQFLTEMGLAQKK